jgi:indoleamine 2,3-dioxygenase
LTDPGFRAWAERLRIPEWTAPAGPDAERIRQLYYVRTGFLASAYINQVGVPATHALPANLARPLCQVTDEMNRPPILSYAGYALYNWHRLDPAGPIEIGNIDTIQNFVTLYDEHWFILVHVDIEARAASILSAILDLAEQDGWQDRDCVDAAITRIADTVLEQVDVLKRIPEYMSAELYHSTFRPYIQHFDDVVYLGVDRGPVSFRGETGAQSSVMPLLVTFFKIPHEPNELTRHLQDMRQYMPAEHRALLERVDGYPDVRGVATPDVFDRALEAIADFRGVHYRWAMQYIADKVDDPTGTGGTPYVKWLAQLREETLARRVTGD